MIDPETKAITERNRIPQSGLMISHLETQHEPKRREPAVDRVQNVISEIAMRRPPSAAAAGWPTTQGSTKETTLLDTQQEQKREWDSVADSSNNATAAADLPTVQSSTKEIAPLETQQEQKRERVPVVDSIYNSSEVPLRRPTSVVGWTTPQGSIRDAAPLEAQQEPKRQRGPVADSIQNVSEPPLLRPPSAAGWSTLQGNTREMAQLETQQELKREKASVGDSVQSVPEAPSRIPSSAAGLPTLHANAREVAHLGVQLEPKRERALAADRVQNASEVPLRRPSSAAGWPTPQGSIREPTLEMQQESKREKAPVPNRTQNAPEVPMRIPPSAAGWPTLQGSVKEVAHLEMQQESKREKVADRAENVPEVPSRRPPSALGSNLQGNIREATFPEMQRELKRERLPMGDNAPEVPSRLPASVGWSALQGSAREAIPLETQQEPKRGRELGADRAQNSSEVPSRMPPPVAGWSTPQGNIREVFVPLEMQQEPKRERAPIVDRAQNALEAPPRRPPSTMGWSTSQGYTRDKVAPTSNGSAAEAPSYSIEQPPSIDVQFAGVNGVQMASSVRTTGFPVLRQGLLSRVQTRTPIPEDTTTSAANCPPPSIQPELSSQRNTAALDRRSPPEPFTIPLANLRSISESGTGTTLASISKTQSFKTPADEGARNGQAAGDSHLLGSANQENVPSSLPNQRGDGFNSRSREDQAHPGLFQSSPATSLRHDASIQPSPSKPFNVVEVSQNVHLRPPASNHNRSHSSTTKVGEEPIIVTSYSSSSKPSEETNARLAHIPLGRHVGQADASTLSSTRIKGDRTSSGGQHIEQDIVTAPTRGAPVDDGTNIAPADYSVPVISRDSGPKSTRHTRQAEHRHPPQTSLLQTIETHVGDALQRPIRDSGTDKKSQAQVNNHFDAPGSHEEKVHNLRTVNQASEDKKPTIQHEGLARILDQPFDRHIKKTGASPSTQSSHSGLPQEELQMPANEVRSLVMSPTSTDLNDTG